MQRKAVMDWSLLWAVVKDHTNFFFILLGMGLAFGLGGGGIFIAGYGEVEAMIFGGFFTLIGLAPIVAAFVTSYSSVSYYYGQALLRKHGVEVDGTLTRKEAQCAYHQEYDKSNNPLGDGYYLCDLYVEFDFPLNGSNHNGAVCLSKAEPFDKLREGDPLPLKVLRLDPSVHSVRERRLANMLKARKPEHPSLIPEGAEISRLM